MPAMEKFKNAISSKKRNETSSSKIQSPLSQKIGSPAPRTAISPPPRTAVLPQHASSTNFSQETFPPQQPQEEDYYNSSDAYYMNREIYQSSTFGLSFYGESLPPRYRFCHPGPKLKQYDVLEFGTMGKFYVQKALGDRSYFIANDSGEVRYMKIEAIGLDTINGPSIARDTAFLSQVASDAGKSNRENFLTLFMHGTYENRFNYFITSPGECNLIDLKTRIGTRFSPTSFVHIAAQTLQCVHNVQLYGYIHRYIAPNNFVIGRGSDYKTIYIVNFSIAYNNKGRKNNAPRAFKKFSNMSLAFIPRSFHLGEKYSKIDDVESWIYCFIWLFDKTLLESKINRQSLEKDVYHFKKKLFFGGYDDELGPIKRYVREFLHYVESCHGADYNRIIDYPYLAQIIEQMAADWNYTGSDNLDWEPDPTNNNQMKYRHFRQKSLSPAPIKPKRSKHTALKPKKNDTVESNCIAFRDIIAAEETQIDQTQDEDAIGNKVPPKKIRKLKAHHDKTGTRQKQSPIRRKKDVRDDDVTQGDDEILPIITKQKKKHAKLDITAEETQDEDAVEKKVSTNRRKSKTHRDKTETQRKEGDTKNDAKRKKDVRDDDVTQEDNEIVPDVSKQKKKHAKSVPYERERKKTTEKKQQQQEESSQIKTDKGNAIQKKPTEEENTDLRDL